jgi:hypothetical protein
MIDLTKIEKPWMLLDIETRVAMMTHDGPIETIGAEGWTEIKNPIWTNAATYRAKPHPVRGEQVYNGSLKSLHSLHPGDNYSNPTMPARVTMSTIDGLLIPGEYVGLNGATIKIEAL